MSQLVEVGGLVALLAALAFLVEATVEVAVSSWLKSALPGEAKADARAVILQLVAMGIGVVIALMYNLDLPSAVATQFGVTAVFSAAPVVGSVLTGLLMGRGAQWFHDVGTSWLGLDGKLPTNRVM